MLLFTSEKYVTPSQSIQVLILSSASHTSHAPRALMLHFADLASFPGVLATSEDPCTLLVSAIATAHAFRCPKRLCQACVSGDKSTIYSRLVASIFVGVLVRVRLGNSSA